MNKSIVVGINAFIKETSAVFKRGAKFKGEIQTLLHSAAFAAYRKDVSGGDFSAPELNHLRSMVIAERSLDITAFDRWVRQFTPCNWHSKNNCFEVSKKKLELAALDALDDVEAQNAYWELQSETGGLMPWYEMHPEAEAKSVKEMTPEDLERTLLTLSKKLVKGGMDEAAAVIERIKGEAVEAARHAKLANA